MKPTYEPSKICARCGRHVLDHRIEGFEAECYSDDEWENLHQEETIQLVNIKGARHPSQ